MRVSESARARVAASAAVLCGCLLLWAIGAPLRMLIMNFGALLAGLAIILLVRSLSPSRYAIADGLILAAAVAIPLTALLGEPLDGVARWIFVGGVVLQPALMTVPLVAVAFARHPNLARLAAVALASFGCALQPDLQAATMLAMAMAAAALALRTGEAFIAAFLALAGAAAAALRPAALPPVQFVENVLPDAISASAIPAVLALIAALLLFLPAVLLRRSAPRAGLMAFTAAWLAALLAALLGPYPTPVLGFGASAILGYIFSVTALGQSAVAKHRRSSMLPPTTGRI